MTDVTLQLSAVVGVPRDTLVAVHAVFVVVVISAGDVIVGITLSFTVTNCVLVAVLPLPSVTVQVTVIVPSG